MYQAMECFVFGVSGLPSLVAQKTLYIHRSRGLGMRSLCVLYPTRILDSLHGKPLLASMRTIGPSPMSPRASFLNALSLLGPIPSSTMTPPSVSWNAQSKLRGAVELASVAGLTAYVVPNPGAHPDCTYTGGSRIGSCPSSGSSAVLPNGRIVVCRIPGNPNSYRAELLGILLGSHFSPPDPRLRVDCKGAIVAATGFERPIKHSRWSSAPDSPSPPKVSPMSGLRATLATCTKKDPTSTPNTDPPFPNPHQTPRKPPGMSLTKANSWCPHIKAGHMI